MVLRWSKRSTQKGLEKGKGRERRWNYILTLKNSAQIHSLFFHLLSPLGMIGGCRKDLFFTLKLHPFSFTQTFPNSSPETHLKSDLLPPVLHLSCPCPPQYWVPLKHSAGHDSLSLSRQHTLFQHRAIRSLLITYSELHIKTSAETASFLWVRWLSNLLTLFVIFQLHCQG